MKADLATLKRHYTFLLYFVFVSLSLTDIFYHLSHLAFYGISLMRKTQNKVESITIGESLKMTLQTARNPM